MRRPSGRSSSAMSSVGSRVLWAAAGAATLVSATPFPRDLVHDVVDGFSHLLLARGNDCGAGAGLCGANNQYCCGPGQVCTTVAGNVATCVAGAAPGAGLYGLYTTTWTETRTYTSTIMTHWAPAPEPTAGVDCVPPSAEQQACGPICCAGWQTCAFQGQCSIRPGYAEPSTVLVTSDGKVTTRYSAPFRVTGTVTITNVGTGQPASAPAEATRTGDAAAGAIGADGGTNGGGLSAGAIAGIVVGTLAGVALLLLLCFCCIARGLWNSVFGRRARPRDRERVEVVEERYARHGSRHPSRVPSAYSRKDRHDGWFAGAGAGPASASARRDKKKSDGRWWLGLAGAAGTLLALLNLRKDRRVPPRKVPASRYSESYYSYTDATASPSSSSSGRRTSYTRRTGDSRPARSQYTHSRVSGRP